MQKEPWYSVSSTDFGKECGHLQSALNNCIHVLFEQHGEQWKKNACTACACHRGEVRCLRETCDPINCEKVVKNHSPPVPWLHVSLYPCRRVPVVLLNGCCCFVGGEPSAASWEVLRGVRVFQGKLLVWWHCQVPRRDVEWYPLWLLRLWGRASHLPGSRVCQSGVCQGKKDFLLSRCICRVLWLFFPPLFFSTDIFRRLKNLPFSRGLFCAIPSQTLLQERRVSFGFSMQGWLLVSLYCEASQCESVTNWTWIPSHAVVCLL